MKVTLEKRKIHRYVILLIGQILCNFLFPYHKNMKPNMLKKYEGLSKFNVKLPQWF